MKTIDFNRVICIRFDSDGMLSEESGEGSESEGNDDETIASTRQPCGVSVRTPNRGSSRNAAALKNHAYGKIFMLTL